MEQQERERQERERQERERQERERLERERQTASAGQETPVLVNTTATTQSSLSRSLYVCN